MRVKNLHSSVHAVSPHLAQLHFLKISTLAPRRVVSPARWLGAGSTAALPPWLAGGVKHKTHIMICFLLLLLAVVVLCSCLAPHSELQESAVRALESGALMVGRFGPQDDEADHAPGLEEVRTPSRAQARRSRIPSPSKRGAVAECKTALYRKRPTPLMQKRVAVRYGFKCAICGLKLDETWETDHVIPLNKARSDEEAERLNSIDNLQPVHRACHQLKTSQEACHNVTTPPRKPRH